MAHPCCSWLGDNLPGDSHDDLSDALQARGSCYWYGRRISCAQYKWQAYAVGAFAGAHFCSTLLRSINTRCAQQLERSRWLSPLHGFVA